MHNNLIRVLITACHSLIGQALVKKCQGKYFVLGTSKDETTSLKKERFSYTQLDINNRKNVKKIFKDFKPQVVINTAGLNCLERCDNDKDYCWKVNVDGLKNLIYYSNIVNARLVHFSSCFIFDGKKGNYEENDRPFPSSYYGKSKLAGENAIRSSEIDWIIIRTSFVYGKNTIKNSENYVDNVINRLKENKKFEIKENVIINPTYAGNLVDAVWKVIKLEKSGIFHIAGREIVSLVDFAKQIATFNKYDEELISSLNPVPEEGNFGLVVSGTEKELSVRLLDAPEGLKFYFL